MIFGSRTSAKSDDFIKRLQKERTDYNHASQVRMQAKSLLQLSVGIYTEPERFVYELLQNAVDAFTDTGNDSLNILIKAENERFIFMHNGKAFDEKDVEGISDVGNGTKSKDSKKIGYKGIGFKSVFMPSVNHVSVISGDFSFEFNKDKAFKLMPIFRGEEKPLTKDDVPWQVIPIDSPELRNEFVGAGYNVITVVYTPEARKIANKIENLFSDLQFLLFLRSDNVSITFERNGAQVFNVGKKRQLDATSNLPKVTLLRNGNEESMWILNPRYSKEELHVPQEVKSALEQDFNTPDKLKGADEFELSFAIQVEDDKVVPVKNASLFTFLPTSYKGLRQPFLINSNFITDAGRQQLHQESEWNKLIFSKIPELYLKFISCISRQYSNYTEVLPTRHPDNDTLVGVYREALANAFNIVKFVPNINGNRLLRLKDVLVDKTGLSEGVLSKNKFVSLINKACGIHYTSDSLVSDKKIIAYAHDIVHVFDSDGLKGLLMDGSLTDGIDAEGDAKLIRYLHKYCKLLSDSSLAANDAFIESLKLCAFILDEDLQLQKPCDLFFPSSFKERNSQASDVSLLNDDVYDDIKGDQDILYWLYSIGVEELSNLSFLDYVLEHPDYITLDNAIEIGTFLFDTWKTDNYLEDNKYSSKIKELCFLSKEGDLQPLCNLYLGSLYNPEDDLEPVYDNKQLFISDEYAKHGGSEDWAFFLKKCGIGYKIGIAGKLYSSLDLSYPFVSETRDSFRHCKHSYTNYRSWNGNVWENLLERIKFKLYYFSFIDPISPNYSLDKYVFSKVLCEDRSNCKTEDMVMGEVPWFGHRVQKPFLEYTPHWFSSKYKSFLEYVLANVQKFPTSKGVSDTPDNVFINYPSIKELCGEYLPVLEIDGPVHESWKAILPFKQQLNLDDLLSVLEGVSEDEKADKDTRKDYVSRVYQEIIRTGQQCSPEITEWAKNHKLLSQAGEFLPTEELTYITVDGFKDGGNKVYCERVAQAGKDKMLQLLKTLGIHVITEDDIHPSFDNEVEDGAIKERLLEKLPYITVLKKNGKKDFEAKKQELTEKIQSSHFFKCDGISLTYGEKNDTISKSTFSQSDSFYYTGNITPARMEPLMSPLCSFLGLGAGTEGKLMIILITDDQESLVDYLSDSGYDVSELPKPEQDSEESFASTDAEATTQEIALPTGEKLVINRGNVETAQQLEINKEARIHAKPYLAAHGYDVSQWTPESSKPDLVGIIKDPNGVPINVVIRSAKQRYIHLSASSFETLMSNPNNLLIVENHQGIRPVTFEELFGNDSNVNLIFDARHTPREYFKALGIIFKYVKNTEFVVRDPHFSTYDEIKGFGLEMKNDGTIVIASSDDI